MSFMSLWLSISVPHNASLSLFCITNKFTLLFLFCWQSSSSRRISIHSFWCNRVRVWAMCGVYLNNGSVTAFSHTRLSKSNKRLDTLAAALLMRLCCRFTYDLPNWYTTFCLFTLSVTFDGELSRFHTQMLLQPQSIARYSNQQIVNIRFISGSKRIFV